MPAIPKRPGIVTFVAVVLITLGCLSLLGGVCGAAGQILVAVIPAPVGQPKPEDILGNALAGPRQLEKVPGYIAMQIVAIIASFGLGSAMLVAGIGCWRLTPFGRKLAIATTVLYLLYALASQVYAAIYVLPATEELQKQQQANMPPGAPDLSSMTKIIGALGMGCVIAFYITIALLILTGLNVRSARIAFGAAAPLPDGAFEEDRPHKRYEGYDDEAP